MNQFGAILGFSMCINLITLVPLRATTAFVIPESTSSLFANLHHIRKLEVNGDRQLPKHITILSESKDDIRDQSTEQIETEDETKFASSPSSSTYILNSKLESILERATTSVITPPFITVTINEAKHVFSQITYPNTKSYILLIQIHGKCNQPQAAQNMLYEMLSLYAETNNEKIKPNFITFTSAIDAWAQSSHPKAAFKAEKLLEKMMELYYEKDNNYGAEIRPNSITFDTVLHAFSKSKNQARNAEEILERMDYLRRNSDWDVKPNVISFTNVVNAWANQEGGNAQRAQEVMERMEEIHQITKDDGLKANTILMNCVMDAWTKESNWKKAMAILNRMEDMYDKTPEYLKKDNPGEIVAPNTISYNIAMKALVNGKQIKKAQSLFLRMQTFTEPGRMPSTRTYNTILSGYSSLNTSQDSVTDAAKKAALILTKQISLYNAGNTNVKPDTISFSTCMNAIAKSKTYPHKAKKTKEILDLMWDLYRNEKTKNDGSDFNLCPNIIAYNTVLNAAAFSAFTSDEEKQEAFLTALSTFNELRSLDVDTIEPDEVTYGNMLKICANLLPRDHPQRNNMAKQLWKGACESGLVGDLVWNELKRAVPVDLFLELIPPNVSGRRDLPMEWRENVKVEMIEQRKRTGKGRNSTGKKRGPSPKKRRQEQTNEYETKLAQAKENMRFERFSEYM